MIEEVKKTKFIIRRTSDPWENRTKQPCEGAFKEGDLWFIEFAALDEFMEFVRGDIPPLVISAREFKDRPEPSIEIYDGYRE